VDVEDGVTPLYPVQPGRVVKVPAREGRATAAGDPLLQLDDTLAQIQVEEARIALATAVIHKKNAASLAEQHRQKVVAQREAVEAARDDIELARQQAHKAQRRYENNTEGSKEDVESAKLLVKKAEKALKSEEAKLAALEALDSQLAVDLAAKDVEFKQAQLRKAEQGLKECTLRAPYEGTPLRVLASVGETLGPNPKQPALYFCPNGPRIVRAEVEQEFADRVSVGMAAAIQDDSTGGGNWHGKVQRISDWYSQRRSILLEPLQFNDVRTLECIVTIDSNQPPLRIGQRVRVILE
jgi:multidrug resistance efflux pump